MKKLILAPMALAMAFAAQFALAQGMAPLTFAGLDTDSDGSISAEELAAAPPVQGGFVTADDLLTATAASPRKSSTAGPRAWAAWGWAASPDAFSGRRVLRQACSAAGAFGRRGRAGLSASSRR